MKNAFTVYTYHKRHAQRLTVRIKADAASLTIRAALSLREVQKIVLTGNYFQVRVMRSVGLPVCLCVRSLTQTVMYMDLHEIFTKSRS